MTHTPSAHHGHLWTLADGTPVHAPPGRLTRDDDGRVCCHLCGRWFDHLGAHLRRHGWTADRYRTAVGLAAHRALCAEEISTRIATRQAATWRGDPHTREAFDTGRRIGLTALTAADRDRRPAPETVTTNTSNLQRARAERDARTLATLDALARSAGSATTGDLLRHRYEDGASLLDLQRLTGWSRPRVREVLERAGASVRATGSTTPAGRDRRTAALEAHVVARIGTPDVDGWLRAGRAAGLPTGELARRAGRSDTWVRTRLAASHPTAQTG